jgi:hypothetical protein
MVQYIGDGAPEGISFQTATTEKLSFYGVTPVVQQTGIADATNTTTTTSTTTALTTDLDSVRTKLNSVLAILETYGLTSAA